MTLMTKRQSRTAVTALFGSLFLLGTSCVGKVGGLDMPGTNGGGGAGVGPTGAGGSGSGPVGAGGGGGVSVTGAGGSVAGTGGMTGSAQPPNVTGPLTPESAGPMQLRRLTNREYNNIMNDLLGDTSQPSSSFPLDGPTSTGFEAPNSVALLNVQYYFQTADTLAETALQNGKLSIPCTNPTTAQETSCATTFVTTFGKRAYRRPVSTAEQTDLLTVFSKARTLGFVFNEAIAQVVKVMLQSPNFLYHWELGPTAPTVDTATGLVPLSPYQVASRLALVLWETMPDSTLLTAADMGQLSTAAQIQAQVQRMLQDPHAANALFNFHEQWLLQVNGHVTDLTEIVKSSALFTPAAAQALVTEFTQFLTSVYATGDGTFNTLLTAPYAYLNSDLAPIYGVTVTGTGFSKVNLAPTQRAGILTQSAFLSSNADPSADNPVRRGLAIYMNMLCGQVGAVPANVPPVAPPSASTTTRQRFASHAASACAQGCHTLFDPPGFAFENYDAIGSFRTMEAGQNVDATGTFTTPAGATLTFNNAVDLSTQLAQSPEARWCVDRQWFRYMLGRMDSSAEEGSMELAYATGLKNSGYSLRDMLTTMTTSKAFLYRTP